MTLTDIGDALRASPSAWRDIPAESRAYVEGQLLPSPTFTQGQRHWFERWWLACTQADVDAINAVLPAGTQVAAVDFGGQLCLGSDLLTDSMNEGDLYFPAQALIQALVCTYIEPPESP